MTTLDNIPNSHDVLTVPGLFYLFLSPENNNSQFSINPQIILNVFKYTVYALSQPNPSESSLQTKGLLQPGVIY